ncbi:MAG: secretin and TonB N-terminal domain-containing protein, partial [Halomonas sp.]|nr:secretin and TonB N-terminal domain-containing protein [Halomonas sp.]
MADTLVRRFRQGMLLVVALFPCWAMASVLTDVDVRQTERGDVALDLRFSGDVPELNGYPLSDPPRLALDLAGTENGLAERRMPINEGGVEGIIALEGGGRTRLVLDLDAPREFRSSTSGDTLTVILETADEPREEPREAPDQRLETSQGPQVEGIDFQRGDDGAGRLIVTFDRDNVTPRVREGGSNEVVVDLGEVNVPDALNQVYDVTDFATPISRITPRRGQGGSELVLATDGPFAMVSSQSGDQLTVEVQPVSEARQQDRVDQDEDYTGERLSLNFQDIEVRAVLATLADFTGLNLVASDSVNGRVTLNLNDVPWDQALDLILQSQGLASREKGNVIVVAPAGELAELERQELEARDQQETLEPLITEYVEVKYARAEDLAELLRGGDGFGLLTERGRVSVDQRTNTLLIQDTPAQVREIMGTLDRLDVAVRQVQIEARIV